jgi:hypothetical protein
MTRRYADVLRVCFAVLATMARHHGNRPATRSVLNPQRTAWRMSAWRAIRRSKKVFVGLFRRYWSLAATLGAYVLQVAPAWAAWRCVLT